MQRRPLSLKTSSDETRPAVATDEHGRRYDPRVFAVQRIGALAVAAVILVFGVLGWSPPACLSSPRCAAPGPPRR
jgi:hypothetical protein